jgi:hypothetical protein
MIVDRLSWTSGKKGLWLKNTLWWLALVVLLVGACVKTPKPWQPELVTDLADARQTETRQGDGLENDALDATAGELHGAATELVDQLVLDAAVEIFDLQPDLEDPFDHSPDLGPEIEDVALEIEDLVFPDLPPDIVCENLCQSDTKRCNGKGMPELCAAGEDGCLQWQAQPACAEGFACLCGDTPDATCSDGAEPCQCVSQCGPCGPGCSDFQDCELLEGIGTCQWNCDAVCQGKCDDGGTDGACVCGDCDDDNVCTADGCNPETDLCEIDPAAMDGTFCDADADGCTEGDHCQDGQCMVGQVVACSDLDGNCLVGHCLSNAPDTYSCVAQAAPVGTPCDDGDFCNTGEQCDDAGNCAGGKPNTCGLDAEACQEVVCNPFTQKCKVEALPDGALCDDEELCTQLDLCNAGSCVGTQDACIPRPLSTETSLSGTTKESGPPNLASLGMGRALVTWKSGSNRVSGRFVSSQLSLSYPEQVLLDDWEPVTDACDLQLGKTAVAARADGNWLMALTHKSARVWLSEDDYRCNGAWVIRYSIAGFDRDGLLLSGPQVLSDIPPNLYYGTELSNGGKIYDYECGCAKYPSSFPSWIDIDFPDVTTVPGGGIAAVTYADDSFGIAYWQEVSNQGYYRPLSGNFEPLPVVELGTAVNIEMCVSPSKDVALLVYADGAGALAGRFLDHDAGDALSDTFAISTVAPGKLSRATCAGLEDGSFVVTNANCPAPYDCDTTLQLVAADGDLLGDDVELHLNDTGEQLAMAGPVVYPDGRYLVVYHDDPYGGIFPRVKSRTYSGELVPQGAARQLSADENVANSAPVARLVAGNIVAAWWRTYQGVTDVVYRALDTDGNPVPGAPEVLANSMTSGAQGAAAGVELANAQFALVWQAEGLVGGMGHDIALRRFGPTGVAVGPEIRVNTSIVGDQMDPGIAYHLATDTLLVTWQHDADDGSTDIRGRRFSGEGIAKSDEFQVSLVTPEPEDEYRATPVFLADGTFVVSYTGWSSPGYLEDIFAQFFANDGTPLDVPGTPSLPSGKVRMNYGRGDRQDHSDLVAIPGTKAFVSVSAKYAESNWAPMSITARKLTLTVDGESGLFILVPSPGNGDTLITEQGNPEDPTIVTDGDKLLVCWKALNFLHCQSLTFEMQFAGSAFTVDSRGFAKFPKLAARGTNHFLLTYDQIPGYGDGDLSGVVLQQFDGSGTPIENAIIANLTVAGDQSDAFLLPMTLSDLLLVGWTSNGQDGDGDGIVFRVLE